MSFANPNVEEITGAFAASLPGGWQIITAGRERFGSWEWQASHWPDRRRPQSLIVLALTPSAADDWQATRGIMDAWAGAEIHGRFLRTRVATVDLDLLPEWVDFRRRIIETQVQMAARASRETPAAAIVQTYGALEQAEPPRAELDRIDDRFRELPGFERPPVRLPDLLGLVRERGEVSVGEAAEALGLQTGAVLELAFAEVREGRVRIQQRGREIYLLAGPPELNP
jgi:hypothetical protein